MFSLSCIIRLFAHGASGLALLLLLGCPSGGGGDGGYSSDSAPPPPVPTYTIGGTVSGLAGSGLVLGNNGGNDLAVSADGSFSFTTALANGGSYDVAVLTQPSNPAQTCTVTNGSGTVMGANVTNVSVVCVTNTYTIGGTVSGLSGSVVLQNSGADALTVSANGSFTFATPVTSGNTYNVTVLTQPTGSTCTVVNGSGTVGSADVTNVVVNCLVNTYSVGGTVSGLSGLGLVLRNNGGDDLASSADGAFTFSTVIAHGGAYKVTVRTHPSQPRQLCTVTNGEGTLTANVTNVSVRCHTRSNRLAVNRDFNCALLAGGVVKCWGRNQNGQLGLGDTNNRGDAAGEMGAVLPAVSLGTGRTAVQVTTGFGHVCAILDTGAVKCWGGNGQSQLGIGNVGGGAMGDQANEMGDNLPAVSLGTGRTAVQISAGDVHTCAILDNGMLKCWGSNGSGELGLGDTATRGSQPSIDMGDNLPAVDLGMGRRAIQVVASIFRTCALLDNGTVKCWGNNAFGQLGLGDTATRGDQANEMGDNLPAVDLGTGRTALEIAVSRFHACAWLDNGAVKCWGRNDFGELGLGDTAIRGDSAGEMGDNLPAVDLGSGVMATQVMTGSAHSCARLDTGAVKCWGNNVSGSLGQGDTIQRGDEAGEMGDALPVVNLGTGRTALEIADSDAGHTCARLDNGAVKCWGTNFFGELGLGDTANRGDQANEVGDNLPAVDLGGTF